VVDISPTDDTHQPAEAAARDAGPLELDGLRRLLEGTCASAELPGPAGPPSPSLPSTAPLVPAAVLIGLLGHPEGPSIILTQRTAELNNHPAEISLPGGRVEADDEGPVAAALREAFEEIRLPPERVQILGCLPPSETISHFLVYPLVGWVEPPIEFEADKREVAEVFEVPLSFVLDPANHQRESLVRAGIRRHFYVIQYRDRRIWGATAGILVELARILGPTRTPG
jgi:8-oxo-dGTP pyrophosphatase MutT (NUDIX family)